MSVDITKSNRTQPLVVVEGTDPTGCQSRACVFTVLELGHAKLTKKDQ